MAALVIGLATVSLIVGVGLLQQRRGPDWLALSVIASGWLLMLIVAARPADLDVAPVQAVASDPADVAYFRKVIEDGMRARAGGS